MARLRGADPLADGRVPPELLSTDHPTWRDPDAFAAWCARHRVVVARVSEPASWAVRYQTGRDGWAVSVGLCPPTRRPTPAQLAELGVAPSGALDRARAEAEAR